MTRRGVEPDQSAYPPYLQLSFWPSAEATHYVVSAVPFRASKADRGRSVDRGFLDVDLAGLAGLGLTETLELLQDKLHSHRARVSADGGGFPPGPHGHSQAALPGL